MSSQSSCCASGMGAHGEGGGGDDSFRIRSCDEYYYYLFRRTQISKRIFDHAVGGAIVFQAISQEELHMMAKWGQSVGSTADGILRDYLILDEKEHFEWVCKEVIGPVHLVAVGEEGDFQLIKSHGGTAGICRFLQANPKDTVEIEGILDPVKLVVAPTPDHREEFMKVFKLGDPFQSISLDHVAQVVDEFGGGENGKVLTSGGDAADRVIAQLTNVLDENGNVGVHWARTQVVITLESNGGGGTRKLDKLIQLLETVILHAKYVKIWIIADNTSITSLQQHLPLLSTSYELPPSRNIQLLQQVRYLSKITRQLNLSEVLSSPESKLLLNGRQLVHSRVKASISDCATSIKDSARMIRLLVSQEPALLEEKDGDGGTPLLQHGIHPDLIKLLINLGADVSAVNGSGEGLLHLAAGYLSPSQYHDLVGLMMMIMEARDGNTKKCFNLVTKKEGISAVTTAVALLEPDVLPETLLAYQSQGLPVNSSSSKGGIIKGPLETAISKQRTGSVVQTLIQCGANISTKDGKGNSLLHKAALVGNLTAIRILVQAGLDPNLKNHRDGSTPLHSAFSSSFWKHNLLETLVTLVELGTDVNLTNQRGLTPLHIAISSTSAATINLVPSIKYLMSQEGAIQSLKNCPDGFKLLHLAAGTRSEEEFTQICTLLQAHPSLRPIFQQRSANNKNLLHAAVRLELRESTLKLLLKHVSINELDGQGINPLGYTIMAGRDATFIRMMIRHGANPKIKNQSVPMVHIASLYGNGGVLRLLLSLKPSDASARDPYKDTPLHYAFLVERKPKNLDMVRDVVTTLVKAGADLNAKNIVGLTPLHVLMQNDKLPDFIEMVKVLLDQGADVHIAENKQKHTMLHFAPQYRTPEEYHQVVELLIERGLEGAFGQKCDNLETPLHYAMYMKVGGGVKEETVKLLLNYIDIDEEDRGGNTPLALAVVEGKGGEFIGMMVRLGASVGVRNKKGNNLAHIAVKAGNESALERILALHRAEIDVNEKNGEGSTPLTLALMSGKGNSSKVVSMLLEAGADATVTNH